MRNLLVNTVRSIFGKLGLVLLKQYQHDYLVAERKILLKLYVKESNRKFDAKTPVTGIVFSKDRPVQLHALISSYMHHVKNAAPMVVLYTATTEGFKKAYDEVSNEFSKQGVKFVKETSFKKDLLDVLNKLKTEKLFFLVDDIVFINDFDMNDFASFDPLKTMINMRLSPSMNFCYTMQKKQLPPATLKPLPGHDDKVTWAWGDAGNEWHYPMSVDGHLFSTLEISAITAAAEFKAPNSYEGALMRFYDVVKDRPAVCYTEAKIFNNPCNKVQGENENVAGLKNDASPEMFLQKWEGGFCIDTAQYTGMVTKAPHQEMPIVFKKR